jgi:hypothetical protein
MVSKMKFNQDELFKRYISSKSQHWSYEREWRVWYPLAKDGLFDQVPIRPSEFRSLYFGCRSESKFTDEVITLLRSTFPNVRLYRALKNEDTYGLKYEEI